MDQAKKKSGSRSSARGAAMVEYALLLVAVVILGAVGMKALGAKVRTATEGVTAIL